MPKLYALEASRPLCKTFSIVKDKLIASSYPDVSRFSSTEHLVDTPQQLYQAISATAEAGHCLVKGLIATPLRKASRSGSTSPTTPTEWICLDVDGLPGVNTAKAFLRRLGAPFNSTSCVIQYSASMGIKSNALRCHLFFLLDKPTTPEHLKRWLRATNLRLFREHITLNKTGHALRWPLDITTCQNDKLLYVAPPELKPGVTCTFQGERITLLESRHPKLSYTFHSPPDLEVDQENLRNELRLAQGLLALKSTDYQLIDFGGELINALALTNETYEVTGQHTSNGFVHLNLNGGDSLAYYHPEGKPEIIKNFKGEDPIYTPIMIPDYYKGYQASMSTPPPSPEPTHGLKQIELEIKQAKEKRLSEEHANKERDKQARLAKQKAEAELKQARLVQADECPVAVDGYRYFGVIDRNTNLYFMGRYNPTTNDLDILNTKARAQVQDYFLSYDQLVPAYYPFWDVKFEFDADYRIDFDQQKINLYQPSEYFLRPQPKGKVLPPPTIKSFLYHALGSDLASYEAFTNWLAYIVQYRKKTGIAWLLHGHTGTGKGTFFREVLIPIFGFNQISKTSMATLTNQPQNNYMHRSVICLIDEANISEIEKRSTLNAKLKEYITENHIALRKMHTDDILVPNYTNFIAFSNDSAPIIIDMNDRRWSIAKSQPLPRPQPTEQELQQLHDELPQFIDFLRTIKVDHDTVHQPFLNEDREIIQHLSMNSHDEIAHNIKTGNLEYFYEMRPTNFNQHNDVLVNADEHLPHYYQVLKNAVDAPDQARRDDLRTLFAVLTNKEYNQKAAFSKKLGHYKMQLKDIRVRGTGEKTKGLADHQWHFTPELERAIQVLDFQDPRHQPVSKPLLRSV